MKSVQIKKRTKLDYFIIFNTTRAATNIEGKISKKKDRPSPSAKIKIRARGGFLFFAPKAGRVRGTCKSKICILRKEELCWKVV